MSQGVQFAFLFRFCYNQGIKNGRGRRSDLGGNYEKSIYNQLMEVMERLDVVEKKLRVEKAEHKEDVDRLNARISELTCENQLLRDDNERLKSILNNDSSNTSNPPSTDQKTGKPANTYNGREKTGRKAGGRKATKALPLPKQTWKKSSGLGNAAIRFGKSATRQLGSMLQSTR